MNHEMSKALRRMSFQLGQYYHSLGLLQGESDHGSKLWRIQYIEWLPIVTLPVIGTGAHIPVSLSMKDCQSTSSKPAELGSEAFGIRGSAPMSLSEALQNAEDGKQGMPELARR